MSYDKEVEDKQSDYLDNFPCVVKYPPEIARHIYTTTRDAAVKYTDAAYSGCLHDGGARADINALKEFVRGYELGKKT